MNPIKILFVCVHNSARSQMAEAFLNHYGEGKFIAESAGLEKTIVVRDQIQAKVIELIDTLKAKYDI